MKRLFIQLKASLLLISFVAGLIAGVNCRAASSAYYDIYYDYASYYLNLYETYGNPYYAYAAVYFNYYDAGYFSDYTGYYNDRIGYKSNTYYQSEAGPNAVTTGYSYYQEYAKKADL